MNNIMQMIDAVRNPQQFMQNMMQNPQFMQNPILNNAMQMMQNGDSKGIENLARNLYRERGMDIGQAYNRVQSQMGMNKQ